MKYEEPITAIQTATIDGKKVVLQIVLLWRAECSDSEQMVYTWVGDYHHIYGRRREEKNPMPMLIYATKQEAVKAAIELGWHINKK